MPVLVLAAGEPATPWPAGYDLLRAALVSELFGDSDGAPRPRANQDWPSLLAIADWHRLSTVLARNVAADRSVPDPIVARLEASALRDTARSLLLDRCRSRVLGTLHQQALPAMVLKGSALVETVFLGHGSRDMCDIDILVPAARHAEAVNAILEIGYAPVEPDAMVAGAPVPHHDAKLISADGLVPIELHRRLVDEVDHGRFDLEEVWARGRRSETGEHLLPSPHDLLIHVCLHFIAGRVTRSEGALAQVRDIAWIAQRGSVDWTQLWAVSRRFGVADRVALALAVVQQLGLLRAPDALAGHAVDVSHTRRYVATRVLTHRPHAPVGSWGRGRSALRDALWWSRVHLGDVPAGELPDRGAELVAAVIGRTAACWRLGRELAGDPRRAICDLRVGRWLRSLDRDGAARLAAHGR